MKFFYSLVHKQIGTNKERGANIGLKSTKKYAVMLCGRFFEMQACILKSITHLSCCYVEVAQKEVKLVARKGSG